MIKDSLKNLQQSITVEKFIQDISLGLPVVLDDAILAFSPEGNYSQDILSALNDLYGVSFFLVITKNRLFYIMKKFQIDGIEGIGKDELGIGSIFLKLDNDSHDKLNKKTSYQANYQANSYVILSCNAMIDLKHMMQIAGTLPFADDEEEFLRERDVILNILKSCKLSEKEERFFHYYSTLYSLALYCEILPSFFFYEVNNHKDSCKVRFTSYDTAVDFDINEISSSLGFTHFASIQSESLLDFIQRDSLNNGKFIVENASLPMRIGENKVYLKTQGFFIENISENREEGLLDKVADCSEHKHKHNYSIDGRYSDKYDVIYNKNQDLKDDKKRENEKYIPFESFEAVNAKLYIFRAGYKDHCAIILPPVAPSHTIAQDKQCQTMDKIKMNDAKAADSDDAKVADSIMDEKYHQDEKYHCRGYIDDDALGLKNNAWRNMGAHGAEIPLVRVHSSCFTGDMLASLKCDCFDQLYSAVDLIARHRAGGVLIYLNQEGRGVGLANKLRAYKMQSLEGLDTVEANAALGFSADDRCFDIAAVILKKLGYLKIKLLTNNADKSVAMRKNGIDVVDSVPHYINCDENPEVRKYYQTKLKKMNHEIVLKEEVVLRESKNKSKGKNKSQSKGDLKK